jgi:hypothetical protein
MGVILHEAEAARCARIPVKAHNDPLYATAILNAGTFGEQLVDLFFCGEKT